MANSKKQPPTRGRPAFAPTKAQRSKVALCVGCGMAEPNIARVLGVCQNTLRKHFAEELATGRAVKQAENWSRLERAAAGGNVTAQKHLDRVFSVAAPFGPSSEDAQEPEPVIGKKEAAQAAAQTAEKGTGWDGLLN